MANTDITRAPSSSFDKLLGVLDSDDACNIISTPLSMRKYHPLKVLQKRIFDPSYHF